MKGSRRARAGRCAVLALSFGVGIGPVTALGGEDQKITNPGGADDSFGIAVSIDGSTAVVGVPGDDEQGSGAGAALVYVRSGTMWLPEQKLLASDGAPGVSFGGAVAVSGDTIVVGAPRADEFVGAVYVFERSESGWSEQQRLPAPNGETADRFGAAVAVSGDLLIAGAVGDRHHGGWDAGAAYVFARAGSVWTLEGNLLASDRAAGDQFGRSVSISGVTAVVGAWGDDDGGSTSGSAYVFERSGATWSGKRKLRASDAERDDFFGYSVAVLDDTIVVGAWGEDESGSGSGAAYVFERSDETWTQRQKLRPPVGSSASLAGRAVSISRTAIVVGAERDGELGPSAGAAYLFTRSPSEWSLREKLLASDGGGRDRLGRAVAVSAGTALLGAVASAYVFVYDAPPEPADDYAATPQYEAAVVEVLRNDVDPEGSDLWVAGVGEAEHGSVTIAADDRVTYAPDPGFAGVDTFRYEVSDGTSRAAADVYVRVKGCPPAGRELEDGPVSGPVDGSEAFLGEIDGTIARGVHDANCALVVPNDL